MIVLPFTPKEPQKFVIRGGLYAHPIFNPNNSIYA